MKKFRKVWDTEKDSWIIQHKHLSRAEGYKQFIEAFPDSNVTRVAYGSRCQTLRCLVHPSKAQIPKNTKPLYSEHQKKGYVKIKIAQPNVWISKAQWVYMETHPWEDFTEPSRYLFLDGDSRNFNPANIYRMPKKLTGIFAKLGGTVKGDPELTKVRVLQAYLKSKLLDVGEQNGFTYKQDKGGRVFLKSPFKR